MTESAAEHPYFSALRAHCAAQPGAVEDHPWGETVFKVRGKIFCFLGRADAASITVKPEPDEREGLLALPFVSVAPYVGRYGWLSLRIEDEAALELGRDLIDQSYVQIARPKGRRRT